MLLEEAVDGLLEAHPRERPVYVLEVGCGKGEPSEVLFQRLVRFYGAPAVHFFALDLSAEKVLRASRYLRGECFSSVRVLQGDLYQLPFRNGCFHYIFALNVFYWAEKKSLLSEAARILVPEGRILIHDVLPRPWVGQRPLISFALSREQLLPLRRPAPAPADSTLPPEPTGNMKNAS